MHQNLDQERRIVDGKYTPPFQHPINPAPAPLPFTQAKKPENAEKYPQYFRSVMGITHLDVYGVHQLFNVQDPSGCIQHASKKLLLSGVRTGGKSAYKDIKEARDTLNRWLELNANQETAGTA